MATYKGISGFNIKSFATDPSNLLEGEIWYNSTSGTLKVAPFAESWASGGDLNTARRQFTGTGITVPTSLAVGGSPALDIMETYDGSTWTTSPATLGTGRKDLMSVGSQSAALVFGGIVSTAAVGTAESFNGSAWTSSPALVTAKQNGGGAGSVTAAICFAGGPGPSPSKQTQLWNDVAWTTSPAEMNTSRESIGFAGQVDTSVLAFGGAPSNTATESWNGSVWSNEPGMPTALSGQAGAGLGEAALAFGGGVAGVMNTLTLGWDGTAWSTKPSMATARDNLKGSGVETAALAFGGVTSDPAVTLAVTEEFTGGATAATITTS